MYGMFTYLFNKITSIINGQNLESSELCLANLKASKGAENQRV